MTDPDKFEATHRTPQGLVRAKQWFKTGDHPAVLPLEEVDRRSLQRQNLPAYDAHIKGELHVGTLGPAGPFVYPGSWIWQQQDGSTHLRDDQTHRVHAVPLPHVPDEPPGAPMAPPETDRPRPAGTVTTPPEPLSPGQGAGGEAALEEGKEE